ncbi:MAG: DUF2334 domain-containing protein [Acetivibrionales bacterium]|jgi:predicted deacetylase
MKACSVYRIDDVVPEMIWENFEKFINLFGKYNVVPLLGVVPDNQDPKLKVAKRKEFFWEIIKKLKDEKRVEIAQHGYQHRYRTQEIGSFYKFCGFKPQSEFYGIPYKKQFSMIQKGKEILKNYGLETDIWMAPGHSFDKNTLNALKALKFRAITDGIGVFPTMKDGILHVPQQVWGPVKSIIGVKTICLHLNGADDKMYRRVEEHLKTDPNIVPFSAVLNQANAGQYHLLNFLYKGVFILNMLRR